MSQLDCAALTKTLIRVYAEESQKRIDAGRGSFYDYFCVAYEKMTPEQRREHHEHMRQFDSDDDD